MADSKDDYVVEPEVLSRPEYMLTTVDNPFDPFTQFDEWFHWDEAAGYHTMSLLARLAMVGEDLPEADQNLAIQSTIDEIVAENVSGKFRKVLRNQVKAA
jgi:hypothetical protein